MYVKLGRVLTETVASTIKNLYRLNILIYFLSTDNPFCFCERCTWASASREREREREMILWREDIGKRGYFGERIFRREDIGERGYWGERILGREDIRGIVYLGEKTSGNDDIGERGHWGERTSGKEGIEESVHRGEWTSGRVCIGERGRRGERTSGREDIGERGHRGERISGREDIGKRGHRGETTSGREYIGDRGHPGERTSGREDIEYAKSTKYHLNCAAERSCVTIVERGWNRGLQPLFRWRTSGRGCPHIFHPRSLSLSLLLSPLPDWRSNRKGKVGYREERKTSAITASSNATNKNLFFGNYWQIFSLHRICRFVVCNSENSDIDWFWINI